MLKEINLPLIKKKRKELKFTNEEMAEALGLPRKDSYWRREAGEYEFKSKELPALADKLKLPLEKIFK